MRILTLVGVLLLAAAGVYAGFWFYVGAQIEGEIDNWVQDRRAEGWTVARTSLSVSGFPGAHQVTLQDLNVAAPEADGHWAVAADAVRIQAASPFRLDQWTLRPQGDIRLRLAEGEEATLSAADSLVTLHSVDGDITRFDAAVDALAIQSVSAPLQGAQSLRVEGARAGDVWDVRFTSASARIAEGALGEARVAFGPDITLLSLNLSAQESGLAALAAGFAGLSDADDLTIHEARLEWGPALLDGEGALGVDSDSRLRGDFTIAVSDAPAFLGALAGAGVMDARQANLAVAAVALFPHDDQNRVLLPLNFTRGETRLGPVSIGPAPLLGGRNAAPAQPAVQTEPQAPVDATPTPETP